MQPFRRQIDGSHGDVEQRLRQSSVQRQFRHALPVNELAGGGGTSYDQFGIGLDRHPLGERPHFQGHSQAGILVHRQGDAGLHVGWEAFLLHPELVSANG